VKGDYLKICMIVAVSLEDLEGMVLKNGKEKSTENKIGI
jgi:hypothetical protein